MNKKTLTTCPYCGVGCNFYLVVDEKDQAIAVEASSGSPVSRGQLCIKGWNAYQFVNHAERLQTPLIRRNGKLVAASWDEALDLIANKLAFIREKYGNDALMFFSSAKVTNEENYLMMKLARAVFKTNNVDHCARLCHASTVAGLAATFGSGAMTNSIDCMENADCVLIIGSNTTEQHPLIGTRVIRAKQKGAKVIVVDNRTIRLAKLADLHIKFANGTDVAFLNGLMHIILSENLENKSFIKERTENFTELESVIKDYPPEKVAALCDISKEELINCARMYATAKSAAIIYSMGITQHIHGVDNVRSVANLAMLTGNLGKAGAGVNPLRGQNNVQGACDMGALPGVFSGYQGVTDAAIREKFARAWQVENLPEKSGHTVTTAMDAAGTELKAFYIMGENPVISDPDQHHVKEALSKLDFLVVQDIFLTSTAEFAHVVLPGVTYAEKDGTFTNTERRVQRIRKAVTPIGNAKADWEILGEVAKRFGYQNMQYQNPGEILAEIAAVTPSYAGINFMRLDQGGLQWPCPAADHPGTPILHIGKFTRGLGKFIPAQYLPPAELPDAEYPLLLSTGRCYFHYHTGTMTRRTRLLEREEHFPYVEINFADAIELNIRDREWVELETRRGKIKVMARVTKAIEKGVLFMPFHFAEAPANALTINARDAIAQIPEYKICAARIIKIIV
ncbi:MAG: formate dehydrogenase subunit alpha [Gammaproteobacteria bacterium]|nr:formate dehydrogenase subunit alpha [Gammaproteobacteria bacterium]